MRHIGNLPWEAQKASVSLAGFRTIVQAQHTATTAADSFYTVQRKNTNRVVIVYLGTTDDAIHYEYNAVADATKMPVLPKRYFIVDAEMSDKLHFYNTTGADITLYIAEIE